MIRFKKAHNLIIPIIITALLLTQNVYALRVPINSELTTSRFKEFTFLEEYGGGTALTEDEVEEYLKRVTEIPLLFVSEKSKSKEPLTPEDARGKIDEGEIQLVRLKKDNSIVAVVMGGGKKAEFTRRQFIGTGAAAAASFIASPYTMATSSPNKMVNKEWLDLVKTIDRLEDELRECTITQQIFDNTVKIKLAKTIEKRENYHKGKGFELFQQEKGFELFQRRYAEFVIRQMLDRPLVPFKVKEAEKKKVARKFARRISIKFSPVVVDRNKIWSGFERVRMPSYAFSSPDRLGEDTWLLRHEAMHVLDLFYRPNSGLEETSTSLEMLRASAMELMNSNEASTLIISPWYMYPAEIDGVDFKRNLTGRDSFKKLIKRIQKKMYWPPLKPLLTNCEVVGNTYERGEHGVRPWAEAVRRDILKHDDKVSSDAAWFGKELFLDFITRNPFNDGLDPVHAEIAGRVMALVYKRLYDKVFALTEEKFLKDGTKLTQRKKKKIEKKVQTALGRMLAERIVKKVRKEKIDEQTPYENFDEADMEASVEAIRKRDQYVETGSNSESKNGVVVYKGVTYKNKVGRTIIKEIRDGKTQFKFYEADGSEQKMYDKSIYSWTVTISKKIISTVDPEEIANEAVKITPSLWSINETKKSAFYFSTMPPRSCL